MKIILTLSFYIHLVFIGHCYGVESPSQRVRDALIPCYPDDNDCNCQAANQVAAPFCDGVPEFGIRTIDPLLIQSPIVTYNLVVSNMSLTGMRNCNFHHVRWNFELSQHELNFHANIHGKADYVINGSISGQDIKGSGQLEINLENIQFNTLLPFYLIEKYGTTYVEVMGSKGNIYNVLEKVDFKFTSCFHTDGSLNPYALNLLNSVENELNGDILAISDTIRDQFNIVLADGIVKLLDSLPLSVFVKV